MLAQSTQLSLTSQYFTLSYSLSLLLSRSVATLAYGLSCQTVCAPNSCNDLLLLLLCIGTVRRVGSAAKRAREREQERESESARARERLYKMGLTRSVAIFGNFIARFAFNIASTNVEML